MCIFVHSIVTFDPQVAGQHFDIFGLAKWDWVIAQLDMEQGKVCDIYSILCGIYICHVSCPLTPSYLNRCGAKLLSLLTSATLLLGQQRVEFMQLAVRLANYVHFISCSGKEKANMLTHSHTHSTHTRSSSHPSLGQTSGTAAVRAVCVSVCVCEALGSVYCLPKAVDVRND